MANLYVIAGHGHGDSGACGNGYQEAERVRALARRIKELGGSAVTLHPFSDNAYASGAVNRINVHGAQVVELHMDSGAAGARGAHVIYKGTLKPDKYDRALAGALSAIFPGRAYKLVGRNNLANINRAANRGIAYRLVENGFISNAKDVRIFNSRIDDIARVYLSVFGITAGSAPAVSAPAPSKPAPSSGIAVDGWWGPNTTKALQRHFGTPVDGVVSSQYAGNRGILKACSNGFEWVNNPKGSMLIIKLQKALGVEADGILGANTINALERHYGFNADGFLGGPSNTVKSMQKALNAGKF